MPQGTPLICTIIAKNYLSFARALCDSFLARHPEGECRVLLVDDIDGHFDPASERFRTHFLGDLEIPSLREFCFKYTVTELSTAVKPFFLRFLLEKEGAERVVYLDPDILVLHRLDSLFDALGASDILLTPHLDSDFPDDGDFPDDSHILRSGIFNLGFIGVRRSENASRFLRWWEEKLYSKCVINHARGYFVDQRFVDLAYSLFENIQVIRDRGYNVAYWNLHSRSIGYHDGVWTCNGDPLYFFHFSNFKPEDPDSISGFQNRIRLRDRPALKDLYDLYLGTLLNNGYMESSRWPYTHGYYSDNTPVREGERRAYRMLRHRYRLPDPFHRKSHPFPLRVVATVAGIIGSCRAWVRNRAVKHDGFLRRVAVLFYGPFPLRKG